MKINDQTAASERPSPALPAASSHVQWEYRSVKLDADADISYIGAEGWELVSVVPVPCDPSVCLFHFKRYRTEQIA